MPQSTASDQTREECLDAARCGPGRRGGDSPRQATRRGSDDVCDWRVEPADCPLAARAPSIRPQPPPTSLRTDNCSRWVTFDRTPRPGVILTSYPVHPSCGGSLHNIRVSVIELFAPSSPTRWSQCQPEDEWRRRPRPTLGPWGAPAAAREVSGRGCLTSCPERLDSRPTEVRPHTLKATRTEPSDGQASVDPIQRAARQVKRAASFQHGTRQASNCMSSSTYAHQFASMS